jgi:transcriptional regulator of acetoin/glycerol metabolism
VPHDPVTKPSQPSRDTRDQTWMQRHAKAVGAGPPVPGVVVVWSGGRPTLAPLRVKKGEPLSIGRGDVGGRAIEDACMSRRHAVVGFARGTFTVRDLASRNGTFLDGARLEGEAHKTGGAVLRVGDTVLLLRADVGPFEAGEVERRPGGVVLGPTARRAWDAVERAARADETLHVTGETGAGKELAARHFHATGPRASGPFVPVNCAAIPPGLAERLLFGARKGAYSGADADTEGYVQAADGGTLFLDEVAELPLDVQAKLLRVLESHEVLALGAVKAKKVTLGLVSATHGDLRARVASGRFREDLYFRLGRPAVLLPPLRDRLEDLPNLVDGFVRAVDAAMAPHVSLVEAALLRPWPGNVRELAVEVAAAARAARDEGASLVEARHLGPHAGLPMATAPADEAREPRTDDVIEQALRRAQGNVSAAARALGMHRTQVRRWIARRGVDRTVFAEPGAPSPGADDDEEA